MCSCTVKSVVLNLVLLRINQLAAIVVIPNLLLHETLIFLHLHRFGSAVGGLKGKSGVNPALSP
jgi:hypothetical protein